MSRRPSRAEAADGDPLGDLIEREGVRARPRPSAVKGLGRGGDRGVWWVAMAASGVWVACVAAFSYARFQRAEAIGTADWALIAAAAAGPLLLIWVIAWLVRRTTELRDDSRRLARAAVLLADAAEAEREAVLALPSAVGETGEPLKPQHLNREIERATHAMDALQQKMGAMEEAMARHAAAFDDAAERADVRARQMRESLGVVASMPELPSTSSLRLAAVPEEADAPLEAPGPVMGGTPGVALEPPEGAEADVIDASLPEAPASRVDGLRAALADAASAARWPKLAAEPAPTPEPAPAPAPEPAAPQAVDPFDDLGPAPAPPEAAPPVGPARAVEPFVAAAAAAPPLAALGGASGAESSAPPLAAALDRPQPLRQLDWRKFARAANFPESEQDKETLDALFDVLTDPEAAALLQSAEDVLATLAEADLYMEDFVPEPSPVSAWKTHLAGRSEALTRLDAPVEESRVRAKIDADPAFADLSERFAERYRTVLRRLFDEAGDDRIALELANSRTGRAYLLVEAARGRI